MKTFAITAAAAVLAFTILVLGFGFWGWAAPSNAEPEQPVTVDSAKHESYGTPVEKTVVLSDGRKLVCLQASYGGLWCTPAKN